MVDEPRKKNNSTKQTWLDRSAENGYCETEDFNHKLSKSQTDYGLNIKNL